MRVTGHAHLSGADGVARTTTVSADRRDASLQGMSRTTMTGLETKTSRVVVHSKANSQIDVLLAGSEAPFAFKDSMIH